MLYRHASNSQDSIIGLVTRIRVGRSSVWIPVSRCERASRFQKVQTGCKAHPACLSVSSDGSFPGVRVVGAWGWPLASIYSRDEIWVCVHIPHLPMYVFTMCAGTPLQFLYKKREQHTASRRPQVLLWNVVARVAKAIEIKFSLSTPWKYMGILLLLLLLLLLLQSSIHP